MQGLGELIPLKGIEVNRAWCVVATLSSHLLSGLDGKHWRPFLLVLWTAHLKPDVVAAWPWDLIAIVLASICEVCLLTEELELGLLLGPLPCDAIVVGGRRVVFVFSFADEIEVGFPGSPFGLELGGSEPKRLLITLV